jgi:glycosyltransferase involved in cell wall biosynthesis
MKKLLFDGLATQSSPDVLFHGGGEFAKFVLKKSIEYGYCNFDIVFSNKMIIDERIKGLINGIPGIKVYYVNDIKDVYTMLTTGKYECFFSALAVLHKNYNSDIMFIMVVHGLRPLELSWDSYRWQYSANTFELIVLLVISHSSILQNILRKKHRKFFEKLFAIKNKKIITVSNHSKYAMYYYFPKIDIDNIAVYYSPNVELGEIEINSGSNGNNYFLMISANRWEKNVARAVKAFDALFDQKQLKDKHVVITGCTKVCRFLKGIKNKDKFKILPYITETELENLYRQAFAFIFPSLNEGFGMPPLRAMKFGIPVIASSATSIPEVCKDAALYFNPNSIEDLANRILQLTNSKNLYETLVRNGYQQYQQYQQYRMPEMIKEIFE